MKIPNKITKRQYTALNKKNRKYLDGDIWSANHDFVLAADYLADNVACLDHIDKIDGGYQDTTKHYRVELNTAYRSFITTRNKIYKAYQKGISKK